MRRRRVLAAVGSTAAAGFAGCTLPGERRHPFANGTVSVRIDGETDTPHDVEDVARRSLEYWEDNSETYVGFTVAFDVVTDDDPDLVLRFVDRPDDCHMVENYSDRVLGCAPVLRAGYRPRETIRAIVVAGARPPGKIAITTKHELGHVLGLGHDDEPQEIMSTRPELRIPMYETRIEIWEDVLGAHEHASNATVLFDHAATTWTEEHYEGAAIAFHAANANYEAVRARFEGVRERIETFADDPRVETVDLEGLRGYLDRLVERTRLAEEFSSAMAAAADAVARGDRAAADEYIATANDRIGEYNAVGSLELRDVAIALGLVRGFDRDEPVAEVDVDENDLPE